MTPEEITEYIFIRHENCNADAAIVFGVWGAWKEAVIYTHQLYEHGCFPKIIVSHGTNEITKVKEAEFMHKGLLRLGIPKESLFLDAASTNTLENVLHTRDLIEKEIGLESIQSLTAVMQSFHARRVLMTLRRHFPPHIKLQAAPYIPHTNITRENWSTTSEGQEAVMSEIKKIETYLKQDDIAEL